MKDKYLVKSGYNEFPASEYQMEIFKTIEKGVNNLIINASAGSSKTTTIVNAIRFIPEKKKILFVAFNKDIVEKISSSPFVTGNRISIKDSEGYESEDEDDTDHP